MQEDQWENLLDQLEKKLHKVNKELVFKFSAELVNGKREFIISADGLEEAFPSVIELVDRAPELKGFNIIAFRQPSQEEYSVSIDDISLTSEQVYFDYLYNSETELVDLKFFIEDFNPNNMAHDQAVFIMMDSVLGEYDAATRVDSIELQKLHEKERLYPIMELRKRIVG